MFSRRFNGIGFDKTEVNEWLPYYRYFISSSVSSQPNFGRKNPCYPYYEKLTSVFIKRLLLFGAILFFSRNASGQMTTDTFKLYFDLNVPSLNSKAENRIDLLIYNDRIINGSSILIIGYADYVGDEKHNKSLSVERAQNVKNYLIHDGINAGDIKLVEGKGEVLRRVMTDRDGYPPDRRVDIVVKHELKKSTTNKKKNQSEPSENGGATTNKTSTVVVVPETKIKLSEVNNIADLKVGTAIVLDKIYFPAGRHVINSASFAALEKLYEMLDNNPSLKINIEGHVCCITYSPDATDVDTDEPILSLNRAKAIYDYLIKKGIEPTRLSYEGFGKTRPIILYEKTEADAEKNRRVEIRIVENGENK